MTTLLRAVAARTKSEILEFSRESTRLFFTLAFPVVLYAIFASAFGEDIPLGQDESTNVATIYLAGMIAVAIMSSAFQNTVIGVASAREESALRRLYTSPMPRITFLLGRLFLVVLNIVIQVAVLLGLGHLVFDAHLPTNWGRFAWVIVLGTTACTTLGIAFANLVGSAQAAFTGSIAVTNVLAFLSGCYISLASMPDWMVHIGQVFPLAWLARGLRSSMIPDAYATAVETGGSWQVGTTALILGVWVLAALVVALTTFKWSPRDAG